MSSPKKEIEPIHQSRTSPAKAPPPAIGASDAARWVGGCPRATCDARDSTRCYRCGSWI